MATGSRLKKLRVLKSKQGHTLIAGSLLHVRNTQTGNGVPHPWGHRLFGTPAPAAHQRKQRRDSATILNKRKTNNTDWFPQICRDASWRAMLRAHSTFHDAGKQVHNTTCRSTPKLNPRGAANYKTSSRWRHFRRGGMATTYLSELLHA